MNRDPDYQRSEDHGGVIGDLMTDGREAIQFFKDSRPRLERAMQWFDAFDNCWLGRFIAARMGVPPKQ